MSPLLERWTRWTREWSLPLRCGVLIASAAAACFAWGAWRASRTGFPARGTIAPARVEEVQGDDKSGAGGLPYRDVALAAALAGAICLAGALPALVIVAKWRGTPHAATSAALLGMFFRMGVPLAALMILGGPAQTTGLDTPLGNLRQAGVVAGVLFVYPVTLLVEVALAVSLIQRDDLAKRQAKGVANAANVADG